MDIGTLQAIAAVGQPRLMERIGAILAEHDLVAGQVLLTPHDFGQRSQYLHARETLRRLLDLGVVPVVNENDTIADDEIRYGDNDRLAALVSHMVGGRAARPPHRHRGTVHRRPASRRASVADRGDRRGRCGPRVGRGRCRDGTGKRRDGEQARGGEDRHVVGRAGRDRRGRGARRRARRDQRASRRHRGAATAGASLEPEAVDRVRPARERPGRRRRRGTACAHGAGALAPARRACARSKATSTSTTRSRSWPTATVRQGPGALRRIRAAGGRGTAHGRSPRGRSARGHPPRRPRAC